MSGLIDFHSHFIPDWYAAEAQAAGIVDKIDGMPGWPAWSAEAHLEVMEANGIERSMISLSAPGVHFGDDAAAIDLARRTNDFGAELVREHPERFGLMASLPLPDVDAAIAEAKRALDELGAAGIAVKTNTHGSYLADAANEPLWQLLSEHEAVVVIHPTASPGSEITAFGRPSPMIEYFFDSTRAVVDLTLSGVFERHPGIRWVVPHLGGALPMVVDRVNMFQAVFAERLPGDRPNTSTRSLGETLRGLWFDLAGMPLPNQARALAEIADHSHILYGSDWCFTPPPLVAQQIASLDAAWAEIVGGDWRELTTENGLALLATR